MKKILLAIFCVLALGANDELVLNASNSFTKTMRKNPDAPVKALLQNAKAVVIFPSITKVGFVLGGMHGKGVMLVGNPYAPSEMMVVDISGGSIGLQLGYENSALVLFILKDSLVADIKDAKITINADASFAFADTGKFYGKVSDFSFTSDIYAYTDNDGFFAGASFGGAVLAKTNDAPLRMDSYGYNALMGAISKY